MVASIGTVASPSQGVSYYERDGYYAKDDPAHRDASAWAGRGAGELGLEGTVDPDTFRQVLEGRVPDTEGRRLGRMQRDGTLLHRPGRDLTLSAPKSVSLAALVGGDRRIVAAHDNAVKRTLAWVEKHVLETRAMDPASKSMVRVRDQKMVAATFTHDTSRNLDPQLHTHAVIANMLRGGDGKWRTMANEKLYASKMLIGALYRGELARGLGRLGYEVEKTHADGRFEIAGVSREVIDAFSTRRAAIRAAMEERGLGNTKENPRLAERAALMTRAYKRDVDHAALREHWQKQAESLGFDAQALASDAMERSAGADARQRELRLDTGSAAERAVAWAVTHLSEREAVFSRTELLTAALTQVPGEVDIGDAVRAMEALVKDDTLHAADIPVRGDSLTTDRAVADELETIGLMEKGRGAARPVMRSWRVTPLLHRGRLTFGQKEAVKLILSSKDRVVGVQGYAGTGKTTMLDRARVLAEKNGYRTIGLAPSASAAKTLGNEAGMKSETLQRFLARNAGVAAGRLTDEGAKNMREAFGKTVLVVDEASLASTVQMRDLLRIADVLRIPRLVLVGDEKQLDAVDAGKPFAQFQSAGMKTAKMDEIMRQRDEALKEAVRASLAGEVKTAFEKLGGRIAEAEPDNLAGAAAARWLMLREEAREKTGLMAPSHTLRQQINGHIRERLVREGKVSGPGMRIGRLVSRGYTRAEMTVAGNYSAGDTVAFHRPYTSLGVGKGDERAVRAVDQATGTVFLEAPEGGTVAWQPLRVGASRGAVEVYKSENIELRAGDRIRWTRNDRSQGLVNSHMAEVVEVGKETVTFRLEDGRTLEMDGKDPQMRHLDRAWASTVHAFQGRTVDNVIAVMEASHPHLTTQKSFYVEISRARHRAELVTDDRKALGEHLETATGERVAALEALESLEKQEAPSTGLAATGRVRADAVQHEPAAGLGPKEMEFDLGM